ncbi:MAG: SCO family protein [Burkholderiaceae bacterium]|nr:SCO family protein [Burkholderiaceae bacterium]
MSAFVNSLVLAGLVFASLLSEAIASTAVEPDYRKALAASQAAIGRTPPAFSFTDSFGRRVSLDEFRGKPVIVSFIYTGCFQACPVATQFLAKAVASAQQALGADSFRVVSIGFNQPFDTPQAMAAFARQNGIRDPQWAFLSPDAASVQALSEAFGFSYEATPKGFDHVTQVSVVDARGTIYRQVYGESFDLPMLVGPLKQLLSGQASESFTLENVWEKVKLYCTVYDPFSGRYRLDYSLFFELFAGITTLGGIGWLMVRELRRRRPT